jgi:signal transduction histidine kinase
VTTSTTNSKTLLYESKDLQEAFATIAHQWRQPLSHINALVGSVDNRLYELGVEDSLIGEYLLEIEKITKEMSKSIDSYRGLFREEKEKFLLKELLESIKNAIGYMLKEENIDLELFVDDDLIFYNDSSLLQEVLVSIINNAKDALVARNIYKPRIQLSAWHEEEYLFIKVCDNAGGMSKSVMRKIFEQNFTTKHTSEGTGVGLFMVKKLLDEEMNAQINVKNVESGVCFTLQFPRTENE